MKRIILVSLVSFMTLSVLSQKVTIQIMRTKDAAFSEWQILDEKYMPVLKVNEYPVEDSVVFSLEANKRYFLMISVSEIKQSDTSLYSLSVNDNAIILVRSDVGSGDHFFPFFTGIKDEGEAKITGGSDTDISEFPWQVYLEAGGFVCGGSIISDSWIITAAHCIKGDYNETIPVSEMNVTVGANNPRNSLQGKQYFVSEAIVHEQYDLETYNNDIALLKLKEPVAYPNAVPIKLISSKDVDAGATDPGVMSWVTGYGATKVTPQTFPATLQKVQLPIVTNKQASVVWENIPESDMMAGYRDGNMDACIGDSGGPLVVPVSDGYKLAGLVSWGSNKCDTYGAYTRLSLFESWITDKTGIEITFRAPVPQGDSIICPGIPSSNYNVNQVNGVTAYNWTLKPDDAGTISSNNENATVLWNPSFIGPASVILQISRNDELSEISNLIVNKAKYTRIISEPKDTVMCAEQPFILKVEAEGYNMIYTWYKNGDIFNTGPSGEITIPSALADDSGNYYCAIEGSCGNAVSGNSDHTILPVTKINYITPDTELLFGDDLTLEVISEGHNLTYQWFKDDNRLNQSILSSLILQNVDANDIGLYKTEVSGTCGTETSTRIYVYVKPEDSPEEYDIYIWPTIVTNEFRIAVNNDKNFNYFLLDNIGKLIQQKRNCEYQTLVDVGKLPAGIYIVTVYNNDFRKSVKIIKK